MAFSSTTLLLSSFLSLFILLPSLSTANEGNILITGDILPTDGQLSVPDAILVIQNDCNLVLYNKGNGFQSGTSGLSTHCTLTLSEFGQLLIKNADGSILWSSPYTGPKGEYAVILQPDGQLSFYGPALWSTPVHIRTNSELAVDAGKLGSEPAAPNVMFSSEVLGGESKLVSRDYALGVSYNCSLQFTKASAGGIMWESPSHSSSRHCFARLNFHGQLSLVDDDYKVLWETKQCEDEGVYALVVKINGQATIYGHRYWSTAQL